ncbi:hypothetical protein ACQWU4_04565 [Chryseobacterium sp. MIQD13]|uniref:hypothetical protein n=1 Tax=Chryseobacterium sp. MIQD13 TaxID=3422310 RepID=UPI003D2C600F
MDKTKIDAWLSQHFPEHNRPFSCLYVDYGLIQPKSDPEGYEIALGFYIKPDYDRDQLKSYLKETREYINIPSVQEREDFLKFRLSKLNDEVEFIHWKFSQLYTAMGIIIAQFQMHQTEYLELDRSAIETILQNNLYNINFSEIILLK